MKKIILHRAYTKQSKIKQNLNIISFAKEHERKRHVKDIEKQ